MEKYIMVNGISYNKETNPKVIQVLETCRKNKTRIILDYGDTITGESWNEQFDIQGTIGNSIGIIKVPLLIHNKRSLGGGEILTHQIIGIKTSIAKVPLYVWSNQ